MTLRGSFDLTCPWQIKTIKEEAQTGIRAELWSLLDRQENATMPDRTVIQWDKDDLESLGLLKVDVLGLGMLSCLRRAIDLVNGYRTVAPMEAGMTEPLTMANIPPEDPATYDLIQKADTIGVYEVPCSELCGLGHFQMRTTMQVMSVADFEQWKIEKAQK